MDSNRVKKAAEWFYGTVFRDEAIQLRPQAPRESVPAPIRAARSLENGMPAYRQSREAIFVKQGKLLSNYEDDYVYDRPVVRYFPTYQSLTDPELRGYFSWRTKLRRGEIRKTSLSYAFLYIYELLNQIGATDPLDGYRKLTDFRQAYGEIDEKILPYLNRWIPDYVVYYDLDAGLLADTPQVIFDRNVAVLESLPTREGGEIISAVKQLAPRWLDRSKFYARYPADCDAVIVRVLKRMWEHYDTRCTKTLAQHYFGCFTQFSTILFDAAVFRDSLKRQDYQYEVDERRIYRCRSGLWSVQGFSRPPHVSTELGDLLKTIDAVMREYYGFGHLLQQRLTTKWILKLIREETETLLAEKKAEEDRKVTIDFSRLDKIRSDAAVTRDKLMVEEETVEEAPPPAAPAAPDAECEDTPLSKDEYRLLQSLLYGRDCGWVRSSGLMMSVLVDGINEKLFDTFSDSVLLPDERPELIEDYIDDLKEMVHP